jgi:hypothetical protein
MYEYTLQEDGRPGEREYKTSLKRLENESDVATITTGAYTTMQSTLTKKDIKTVRTGGYTNDASPSGGCTISEMHSIHYCSSA